MLNTKRPHDDSAMAHSSHDKVVSSASIAPSVSRHDSRPSLPSEERPKNRVSLHLPDSPHRSTNPSDRLHSTNPRTHATFGLPETEHSEMGDGIEDDWTDQIVMGVDITLKGNVGCCYYVARDHKLLLMSEISGGGLEVLESCACLNTHFHGRS